MKIEDLELHTKIESQIKQDIAKYLKIYYDIETKITGGNSVFSYKDRIIPYPFFHNFEIGDLGDNSFCANLGFTDGYGDGHSFSIEIPFDECDDKEILLNFKKMAEKNTQRKNKFNSHRL